MLDKRIVYSDNVHISRGSYTIAAAENGAEEMTIATISANAAASIEDAAEEARHRYLDDCRYYWAPVTDVIGGPPTNEMRCAAHGGQTRDACRRAAYALLLAA